MSSTSPISGRGSANSQLSSRSSGKLVGSARLIAVFTLASRILGLIRERVFAHYFSTSELLSAFRIAFMIPNLTRRLFGEGALSAAMVPVLTDSLKAHGEAASRRFVGTVLAAMACVLVALMLVLEAILFLWQRHHEDLALSLTTIMVPYMVFICLVAVASGVLNVRGHFAVPAASPTFLNIAIVAGAWIGAGIFGWRDQELMRAVCYAILLSGIGQVVATAYALRVVNFWPIFGGSFSDPQLRRVIALMGPMILGLSAVQINSLLDNVIAYLFVEVNGERVGPAVLGYAQFLYQLPLGVFGISIATAVFPELATKAAAGDRVGMSGSILRGLKLGAFISLPATAGLVLTATPLVAALYQQGEFGPEQTRRVAGTLICYSLGLVAYFAQHVVVRAFYSLQDSATPARIALRMVALNLMMNMVLVFLLEERGLALSTSITASLQLFWLMRVIRRTIPEVDLRGLVPSLIRMVGATLLMVAALFIVDSPGLLSQYVYGNAWLRLGALVSIGLAVYGIAAKLLGIDELKSMLRGEQA